MFKETLNSFNKGCILWHGIEYKLNEIFKSHREQINTLCRDLLFKWPVFIAFKVLMQFSEI